MNPNNPNEPNNLEPTPETPEVPQTFEPAESSAPNPEETGPIEMPTDSFGELNDSTTDPAATPESTETPSDAETTPSVAPETVTEPAESTPVSTGPSTEPAQTNPFQSVNSASDAPEQPVPVAPVGGPATVPTEKKKPSKALIIVAILFLVAGLSTAGYFVYQSLQPAAAPGTETEQADEVPAQPVESAEDIQNEIDAIQEGIDGINDENLTEAPLQDDALNAQ